jgi:hypothetical protein
MDGVKPTYLVTLKILNSIMEMGRMEKKWSILTKRLIYCPILLSKLYLFRFYALCRRLIKTRTSWQLPST